MESSLTVICDTGRPGALLSKATPGRGRAIDGLERSDPRAWRRDKVREAFLRAKE